MKIEITNTITIDGEVDKVREQHDCQLTKKGGFDYLVYTNADKEKVVIKFNQEELVMTRFSTPQTLMRFHKNSLALASVPTPMGVQKLLTRTHSFEADLEVSSVRVVYDLLTHEEADLPLASYDLRLGLIWD